MHQCLSTDQKPSCNPGLLCATRISASYSRLDTFKIRSATRQRWTLLLKAALLFKAQAWFPHHAFSGGNWQECFLNASACLPVLPSNAFCMELVGCGGVMDSGEQLQRKPVSLREIGFPHLGQSSPLSAPLFLHDLRKHEAEAREQLCWPIRSIREIQGRFTICHDKQNSLFYTAIRCTEPNLPYLHNVFYFLFSSFL